MATCNTCEVAGPSLICGHRLSTLSTQLQLPSFLQIAGPNEMTSALSRFLFETHPKLGMAVSGHRSVLAGCKEADTEVTAHRSCMGH